VAEGESATSMFFILRGELYISNRVMCFMRQFSDGMHFGESCLLHEGLRRAATVRAVSNVQLYILEREQYLQVCLVL